MTSPDMFSPKLIDDTVKVISLHSERFPRFSNEHDYDKGVRNTALANLAIRLLELGTNDTKGYDILSEKNELTTIYSGTSLAKEPIDVITGELNRIYRDAVFGTNETPRVDNMDYHPYAMGIQGYEGKHLKTSVIVASPYERIPDQRELWSAYLEGSNETILRQHIRLIMRATLFSSLANCRYNKKIKSYNEEGAYARDAGEEISLRKLNLDAQRRARIVFGSSVGYSQEDLIKDLSEQTMTDVGKSMEFVHEPYPSKAVLFSFR